MNLLELKARAYDLIAALEAIRRELDQVNAEIKAREKEAAEANKAPKLNHTPPVVYEQ